jgi:hypothetical protein
MVAHISARELIKLYVDKDYLYNYSSQLYKNRFCGLVLIPEVIDKKELPKFVKDMFSFTNMYI